MQKGIGKRRLPAGKLYDGIGWSRDTVDLVFLHQVGGAFHVQLLFETLDFDPAKNFKTRSGQCRIGLHSITMPWDPQQQVLRAGQRTAPCTAASPAHVRYRLVMTDQPLADILQPGLYHRRHRPFSFSMKVRGRRSWCMAILVVSATATWSAICATDTVALSLIIWAASDKPADYTACNHVDNLERLLTVS